MKNQKLNKKKRISQLIASFGASLIGIPLISACVTPIQELYSTSTVQRNASNTSVYNKAIHTPNYFKPPKYEDPSSIDTKYTSFDQITTKDDKTFYNKYNPKLDPSLIPQGRNYKNLIANLSEKNIRDDIHDSLVEIVNNNSNVYIDFPNLKLDFRLIKKSNSILFINSFLLTFTLTNNNVNGFKLFDVINIAGESTTKVTISLFEGVVFPSYSIGEDPSGNIGAFSASWGIEASSFNFTVILDYINGNLANNKIISNPPKINFLSSRSFAINVFYKGFDAVPTYNYIEKLALPQLIKMSPQDFKNDINDWFTQYFRFQVSLATKDIETIIKYILTPAIKQANGKLLSPLEVIVTQPAERKKIFSGNNLNSVFEKLLDAMLTPAKGEKMNVSNYENIAAFLTHILKLNIPDYFDKNLGVDVTWIKDPELFLSNPQEPKISYNFKVKTTFKKDLVIKLKGSETFNNKVISYDFNKTLNLPTLIETLFNNSDEKNESSASPFAAGFLKGIAQLATFDQFKISKNEYVQLTYETNLSPLNVVVMPTIDVTKGDFYNFGWQASDTKLTIDVSNIPSFWKEIYKKLNEINYEGSNSGVGEAFAGINKVKELGNKAKGGDITALFQLLTYLFVSDADKNKINDNNRTSKRPVEVLFDSLIEREFVIGSIPMNINLSRAFYYLPKTYQNLPLWTKSNQTYTNNPNLTQNIFNVSVARPTEDIVADPNADHSNADNLNFLWRDQFLWNAAASFFGKTISSNTSVFKQSVAEKQIDALVAKIKTDDELFNSISKIKQVVVSNYINNSQKSFDPNVTALKINIGQAIRSIFQLPVKASLGTLANIAVFFGQSQFDINNIANNLVKMDMYVIIVNLQNPDYILNEKENGLYGTDSANSWFIKIVPPIINFSGVNI